jgi:hypothetical protein
MVFGLHSISTLDICSAIQHTGAHMQQSRSFLQFVGAVGALVAALGAHGAAAQTEGGQRPLVFVTDVSATTPALQQDAAALTTSLCGALARDKRIEVMCAPDVRQILEFAAMGSLTGGASPAVESLERRMGTVAFVVAGTLTAKEKDTFVLVVGAGPRSPSSDPSMPAFEKPTVRFEEVGMGKSTRLLDRLPELAVRLMRPLLAPASTATQPPEPLK